MSQVVQTISDQRTLPVRCSGVMSQLRPMVVRSYGQSDVGRHRRQNEDQFLIAELTRALRVRQSSLPQPKTQYSDERGYLFIVADGQVSFFV
jgi:serine/threonine protein phosphatase PrpC